MKRAYESELAANRYDAARSLPQQAMSIWPDRIKESVAEVKAQAILDLGCGTVRFTSPLATTFGAHAFGVEPSAAMLAVAAKQVTDGVTWLLGSADQIPLEDASVDLVVMSQVYHHLPDPNLRSGESTEEIWRVRYSWPCR